MKAVRADRAASLAAATVFASLMEWVNRETKTAWPSMISLAVHCGTSTTTVKKHLKSLVEAGWLDPVGKAKRGTIKYRIRDDRMNVVLDQVAIDIDRQREQGNLRQERKRARNQAGPRPENSNVAAPAEAESVTEHGFRPERDMSRNRGYGVSQNMGSYEHLNGTPEGSGSNEREEEDPETGDWGNPYARESKGY